MHIPLSPASQPSDTEKAQEPKNPDAKPVPGEGERSEVDKKPWNSLEVTKLVVGVLTPLAICTVGTWATLRTTTVQREHMTSTANVAYDRARKDYLESNDLDITKSYLQLMQAKEVCQLERQISILVSQATPPHADRLRTDFIKYCTSSTQPPSQATQNALQEAVEVSKMQAIDGYIADLEGPGRDVARIELRKLFQESPSLVAPRLARAIEANSKNYQITLGALVVLGSVNGGWKLGGALEQQFNELQSSPNMGDKTFKEWYERARKNRQVKTPTSINS